MTRGLINQVPGTLFKENISKIEKKKYSRFIKEERAKERGLRETRKITRFTIGFLFP